MQVNEENVWEFTNWFREWRKLFREKIKGTNYTQLDWAEAKEKVNGSLILFEDVKCQKENYFA